MPEENTKPDYSFIMNQPGPELSKPKRTKKPFIVLAVAVVVLGALTVTALLVGKKSTNVQQTAVGQNEAKQFFDYLANNNIAAALALYNDDDRPPEADFKKDNDTSSKKVNFQACVFQQNLGIVNNSDQSVVVFRCPMFDKPTEHYIDFYLGFIQTSDGSVKLKLFMIKDIKQ